MDKSKIPTQNINFMVYDSDSNAQLGVAEGTLPDLEAMSNTISGAGIAGEVDVPVLGHFGSMTVTLNWRTVTPDMTKLLAQKGHRLDLRAAIETQDKSTGELGTMAMKVAIVGIPKTGSLGNLNVGSNADSSSELEITYIKILLDGEEVVEIDKLNYICRIHGEDYLASVRNALGLAG